MREVLLEEEPYNVVFSDKVSDDKYYLLVNSAYSDLGVVIRENYKRGLFKVHVINKITIGNQYTNLQNLNLKELIEHALMKNLFRVYEFDTYLDMFQYVIDKESK